MKADGAPTTTSHRRSGCPGLRISPCTSNMLRDLGVGGRTVPKFHIPAWADQRVPHRVDDDDRRQEHEKAGKHHCQRRNVMVPPMEFPTVCHLMHRQDSREPTGRTIGSVARAADSAMACCRKSSGEGRVWLQGNIQHAKRFAQGDSRRRERRHGKPRKPRPIRCLTEGFEGAALPSMRPEIANSSLPHALLRQAHIARDCLLPEPLGSMIAVG